MGVPVHLLPVVEVLVASHLLEEGIHHLLAVVASLLVVDNRLLVVASLLVEGILLPVVEANLPVGEGIHLVVEAKPVVVVLVVPGPMGSEVDPTVDHLDTEYQLLPTVVLESV